MKFTKMSLVAALLVGSSAFAIDNVKVSGDAKLYYTTTDNGTNDLFSKESAAGQAAASLSISADLTEGISAGTKVTALSTLGLQNQLVGNVWEGTNELSDSFIVNDLWLAATVGKTTAKIGRMELDTPLVFTEKWSIVENTFEAAVLINQDIPDTTLVAAYVGGSNGTDSPATMGANNVVAAVNNETTFSQFYKGAYAVGVVNNSWAPLTAQAWYYDASKVATAYWLQADLNIEGILVGAQYTATDLSKAHPTHDSISAYALMVGYEMKDTFTAKLSYSAVSDDTGVGAGYNLSGAGQSKLYTEAWWNYGQVTQADTSTVNVTVESPVNGIVDLGLYVTMIDHGAETPNDADNNVIADTAPLEVTLTAGKSFGPLDASIAYIYFDKDLAGTDASNTLQAYLTYNF
jgi:hypothetical protein